MKGKLKPFLMLCFRFCTEGKNMDTDNYIFRENLRTINEHFSLFFVKISGKVRSHLLVIFRENMVHNKILYVLLLTVCGMLFL